MADSQALFQVTEKPINNYNQPIIIAREFNVNFALTLLNHCSNFLKKKFLLK